MQFKYAANDYADRLTRTLQSSRDWEWMTWHQIVIYAAGVLFAGGWWLWLDQVAQAAHRQQAIGVEDWVCGVVATVGMVMLNQVTLEMLQPGGVERQAVARLFFFVGVMLCMGAVGGSIATLMVKYSK